MFRIKIAIMVIGGALVFFGFQEMRLGWGAKPEPAPIRTADLCEHGCGENGHVVISDFFLVEFAYVYESKQGNPSWTKVWVPAVPLDGEYVRQLAAMIESGQEVEDAPMPKDIQLIVKSSRVKNEHELERLAAQDTLQGMIVNKIESLGREEKKILQQSYPGVNFDKVLILEHDRKPKGPLISMGLLTGGLLLGTCGLGWLVLGARSG